MNESVVLPLTLAESAPDRFTMHRWHVVVLAVVVAAACVLRLYRIDATSVWCDEILSLHISDGHAFSVDKLPRGELIRDVPNLISIKEAESWTHVWSGMGGDMHPPLYYVALRFWREMFGDTPLGIRSLSAVIGTLAVLASFFAGRELSGTVAGLWVAAINVFAADHIYYSQEARMYVLAMLLATVAMAIVLRIDRLGFTRRRGVGLIICSLGGMVTLYLSCAVLIAAAIFALVRLRGRYRNATIACFVIAGAAFAIVWLPFFLGQNFHAMKSDWLKADAVGHTAETLQRLLLLPMGHLAVVQRKSEIYAYAFAAVYVLPALFLRRRPAVLLPWLAVLLVAGFPLVADLVRTTNMLMWPRYTILMVPALSLSLVAMACEVPSRLRPLIPVALVLFCAVSLPATYDMQRYDYRNNAAVAEKAFRETGGRLIFLTTWNEKFDSVLLLSMQYFWREPPHEIVFVESPEAFRALPREVTTDRVILVAGDRGADLGDFPEYASDGPQTWSLGVGSVTTLRRLPATPTTMPTVSGAAR